MKKFSLKQKLLPAAMAAAMVSGFAFSGSANAIHVAEDGIGQVLLAPIYFTESGYKTKVAIVNTSSDKAVKVKVVIRSMVASTEILDFICYMSPTDVCRFEIRKQEGGKYDGQVVMYSDDDSIKSPAATDTNFDLVDSLANTDATFASIKPVTQPLFSQYLGATDTLSVGHIEFFGLYAVEGTRTGYDAENKAVSVTVERGMSKFALAQLFDTPRYPEHTDFINHRKPSGGFETIGLLSPANQPEESVSPDSSPIRSTNPDWMQLMGTIALTGGEDRFGYRIPALAGAVGDNVPLIIPTGLPLAAVWDGLVISNPRWDAIIGAETGIGMGLGNGDTDKVVEIETALAATHLQNTFEDDNSTMLTRLLITFPTRYRHNPTSDPCGTDTSSGTSFTPPFQTDGAMIYQLSAYDNFETIFKKVASGTDFSGGGCVEHCAVDDLGCVECEKNNTIGGRLVEVNYFNPDWHGALESVGSLADFNSGWFDMTLEPRIGCPYEGAPALSFTHKYTVQNGSMRSSWLIPTAHK
ncbi:MAG: hypothetical protein KAI83_01095 [Thiomargarita sp.]|nr:hypothetical protein [Thiomargarita sp.]